MIRLTIPAVAVALVAACGASPAADPSTASTPSTAGAEPAAAAGKRSDVSNQAFAEALAAGDVAVIDVRTAGEYANGHVPGAVLAPLQELSPDHPAVKDHPKDQPLYVICQSGGRSSRAADMLATAGYTTINVEGGTGAWIAAGHETE